MREKQGVNDLDGNGFIADAASPADILVVRTHVVTDRRMYDEIHGDEIEPMRPKCRRHKNSASFLLELVQSLLPIQHVGGFVSVAIKVRIKWKCFDPKRPIKSVQRGGYRVGVPNRRDEDDGLRSTDDIVHRSLCASPEDVWQSAIETVQVHHMVRNMRPIEI